MRGLRAPGGVGFEEIPDPKPWTGLLFEAFPVGGLGVTVGLDIWDVMALRLWGRQRGCSACAMQGAWQPGLCSGHGAPLGVLPVGRSTAQGLCLRTILQVAAVRAAAGGQLEVVFLGGRGGGSVHLYLKALLLY